MELNCTAARILAMSLGSFSGRPSTDSLTGRQAPWDIGRNVAGDAGTGGEASRIRPSRYAGPACTRTSSASWLPSASGGDRRHGQIEEIDRIDLHARDPFGGCPEASGLANDDIRLGEFGGRCGLASRTSAGDVTPSLLCDRVVPEVAVGQTELRDDLAQAAIATHLVESA